MDFARVTRPGLQSLPLCCRWGPVFTSPPQTQSDCLLFPFFLSPSPSFPLLSLLVSTANLIKPFYEGTHLMSQNHVVYSICSHYRVESIKMRISQGTPTLGVKSYNLDSGRRVPFTLCLSGWLATLGFVVV